jgi:hypothetical protein
VLSVIPFLNVLTMLAAVVGIVFGVNADWPCVRLLASVIACR